MGKYQQIQKGTQNPFKTGSAEISVRYLILAEFTEGLELRFLGVGPNASQP